MGSVSAASAVSQRPQTVDKAQSLASGYQEPLCSSHNSLCADPYQNPSGEYVGHDEPSVIYKSGVPGSGNDMTYVITLPTDPKRQPNASGAGGSTWNFQLHPTFWFGLTLCDTESSPEFTKTCTANSDANNLVGSNPAAPDYIGQEAPYAFHPAYSTANPRGNTWSAHTYNVAFSDEIGHFENCLQLDVNFNCASPGAQDPAGLDADDSGCVPGTDSTVVHIDGCFSADNDYDGQSYRNDWPGTNPVPGQDRKFHPSPVLFTSPLMNNGTANYSTVAFETDLPRIEASDSQANPPFCNRTTGANCVNPPNGAQFYPFYSTTNDRGTCTWQEGGPFIPGTINNFGGSSTSEFGGLLHTVFPTAGFQPIVLIDNFNSGDMPNPCPVRQRN
jgi:hypothetical protein